MLYAAAAIFLGSLALVFAGVRGRRVGDDPHCRRCGFNLRGKPPESERCAECGADVTRPRATRRGARQRRAGVLLLGLLLLLNSAAATAWLGYQRGKAYDWIRLRPTAWLLDDLDSADRTFARRAGTELRRRIADKQFPQSKVDRILDHLLAAQADRTKPWKVEVGSLIDSVVLNRRIDVERTRRYLLQGIDARLLVKQKLRRGQPLNIQVIVKPDRLGYANQGGNWRATPLKLGDTVLDPQFTRDRTRGLGSSDTATSDSDLKLITALPDGKYTMTTTVVIDASAGPRLGRPDPLKIPLSVPVELFPPGATVDEFSTDPQLRESMRQAIPRARVFHRKDANNRLDVRFQVDALPLPLACEVVLVQDGREKPVGRAIVSRDLSAPGRRPWQVTPPWQGIYIREKLTYSGKVDVHIRPSQDAADRELALAKYWGEPIVIRDVVVDEPYVVPFHHDESLRGAVEAAVRRPVFHRTGTGRWALRYQLGHDKVPVKLDYEVIFSWNGTETHATTWRAEPGGGGSRGGPCADFDPRHEATTVDVIYRPNPNWEISSRDNRPPWGGELVFRNVKLGEGSVTEPFWNVGAASRPATAPAPAVAPDRVPIPLPPTVAPPADAG